MKLTVDDLLLGHGFAPLPSRREDGLDPTSPGHFWTWLMVSCYKGGKWRDDPMGDLAYDIWRDPNFPKDADPDSARSYFGKINFRWGDRQPVMEALEEAITSYEQRNGAKQNYRFVPPSLRFQVLKRDSYTCQTCGAKAPDARLEIDHKVAIAIGGSNDESNLWVLCYECNRGKGVKAP